MNTSEQSATPAVADPVFDLIARSVSDVVSHAGNRYTNPALIDSLSGLVASLGLPPAPGASAEEQCKRTPSSVMAPLCASLQLETVQAKNGFAMAESSAESALFAAGAAWQMAGMAYHLSQSAARVVLDQAVQLATGSYKIGLSGGTRDSLLHAVMLREIYAAITAYETAMSQPGITLAGAAGELLTAYAICAAAVISAQASLRSANAAAEETFWEGREEACDV